MWNVNCEDREESQQASKISGWLPQSWQTLFCSFWNMSSPHTTHNTVRLASVFFLTQNWGQVKWKEKGRRQVDENGMQPRAPQFKIMDIFCSVWQRGCKMFGYHPAFICQNALLKSQLTQFSDTKRKESVCSNYKITLHLSNLFLQEWCQSWLCCRQFVLELLSQKGIVKKNRQKKSFFLMYLKYH